MKCLTAYPGYIRCEASGRHRARGDRLANSVQSTSRAGSLNVRHVLARAARSAVAREAFVELGG